ncbi:glycosyltransferase family 2 protein [Hymenobacter sp. BT770]|uniref:glycosyltransferase family 2 protein n=1 Tax=Hymenobacter sp. BT770 TaxID=2886942 RepID=UPI001D0FE244|nr:glycosyltransferase family 2 protein [Hymenobacter sp. BT770]MCC3153797.1 glycosyltransferase family 2 protein [Hymenobacter sp. BT770]MDO3415940.1 glycosyltransferase family 2 protein [Hymenobacter sp. BT770]
MPKLSVIIPCYFNEDNVPVTARELVANETNFPPDVTFEYVFVNDGSGDDTLGALRRVQGEYPGFIRIVDLASNVGSYNAIVAGMAYATGDCMAVITADLQDPPELIVQMYAHWRQGYKLVIGNRQDREEAGLAVAMAKLFHWLMKNLALSNIPDGGFDFVFFDRQVATEVLKLHERNSNVFYLMVWMGFAYVNIPYTRRKRQIGKSRWTLSKKVKLFIDSLMAFSFVPIRAISVLGLSLGAIALLYGLYVIALKISSANEPAGWTTLMVVLLFVSAFQMIALGVIGEYVWRGLDAARQRPLYVVRDVF